MTMRFIPTTAVPGSDQAVRYLFFWLDFMRQASPVGPGWTIPRSSNGTTGGVGDNIVINDDLGQYVAGVGESWFVLRSPDGLKEFLWNRYNTTRTNWQIHYSPGALFIGGDETGRPDATDRVFFMQATPTGGFDGVLHMAADDTAPYAFYTYMHEAGDFTDGIGGMAWCPITDALQPSDTDPYVFVYGITTVEAFALSVLGLESNNSAVARCVGIPAGQSSPRTLPCLSYRSSSSIALFPSGAPADGNGNDLSMPVPFGVSSQLTAPFGFKGFTTFMQWNGVGRAPGETFSNRTRVSWGEVNFPWDGSVPEVTA